MQTIDQCACHPGFAATRAATDVNDMSFCHCHLAVYIISEKLILGERTYARLAVRYGQRAGIIPYMTQISSDTVLALARLSNLQLEQDEVAGLAKDISGILAYVEQLNELDTEGVEPTYQVTGLENVWRSDEVETGIVRDQLLVLAPESKDDQIKVPKVL